MRLLLDTHVFLWFVTGDARLPAEWRDSIRDVRNEVYLSVVSLWEADPFSVSVAVQPPLNSPIECDP